MPWEKSGALPGIHDKERQKQGKGKYLSSVETFHVRYRWLTDILGKVKSYQYEHCWISDKIHTN